MKERWWKRKRAEEETIRGGEERGTIRGMKIEANGQGEESTIKGNEE